MTIFESTETIGTSRKKILYTCCMPFWNMCHPETFFRLAWRTVLKNMHFWYMFQICTVKTLSYREQTTICLFNSLHLKKPFFITEKQTKNKQMQLDLTYGLFSKSFMLQGLAFNMWPWYDKVFTVQIWNMYQKCTFFQNGTSCQYETCFRMAHVSKRHATHAHVAYFLTCKFLRG